MLHTQPTSPQLVGMPKWIEQLEGLAVLACAAAYYGLMGSGWWMFALLLLVPDLFMLGYLAGPKWGARIYNLGHSHVVPLGLFAMAWMQNMPTLQAIALIWIAHIGMDRAIGYGLKYESGFKHTHLSWE
jgi:hypothetical protein